MIVLSVLVVAVLLATTLFAGAIADESFLKEVEASKIPDDYKKAFEILKSKMSSLQGVERTQE